jgi:hypothetical protein
LAFSLDINTFSFVFTPLIRIYPILRYFFSFSYKNKIQFSKNYIFSFIFRHLDPDPIRIRIHNPVFVVLYGTGNYLNSTKAVSPNALEHEPVHDWCYLAFVVLLQPILQSILFKTSRRKRGGRKSG